MTALAPGGFKFKLSGHDFAKKRKKRPQHHVLMVEDEKESGFLVEASLKKLEHRIKINWVTTAEEAEKILKKDDSYDLIIADHFLEGPERGLELWKTCQKKYHEIPFLVTSSIDPDVFSNMVADEHEQPLFLHKPFRIDECKNMLEWFWDVEFSHVPQKNTPITNIRLNSNYQIFISALLLALAVILASPELDISKFFPVKLTSDISMTIGKKFIEPFKFIIPTFRRNDQIRHSKPSLYVGQTGLIREILSKNLKREILLIELRADDVLESFGPRAEINSLIFLPRAGGRSLPKGLGDFDGKFERYGHLYRIV